MKRLTFVNLTVVMVVTIANALALMAMTRQELLEQRLVEYEPYEDMPYVPVRQRDTLADYAGIIEQNGWTTNEFIGSLIAAVTQNVIDDNWTNATKRKIAEVAAMRLGEINHPSVTNFFREFNANNLTKRLKNTSIPALFWHTNLEPEVLSYLRTYCVNTNMYDDISKIVGYYVYETLATMPEELKPAATNRVANYMYFAIHHTTRLLVAQDRRLAYFFPPYSNSVQRLDAMKYVQSTTTNLRTRVLAQQEVDRLSAIPTNQLNDISWIAEDLHQVR